MSERYPCTPDQTYFLINFSEDSPENINKVVTIFSNFMKYDTEDDDSIGGVNHPRIEDATSALPTLSFRVYDPLQTAFDISSTGTTLTLQPGLAVINNVLIELSAVNTISITNSDHWIGTMNPGDADGTFYRLLVLKYDPTEEAQDATLGVCNLSAFDPDTMVVLWVLVLTRASSVTTNISFLKRYPSSSNRTYDVVEGPYWNSFSVNGGDLHA